MRLKDSISTAPEAVMFMLQVRQKLKNEGYTRGLAMDPDGQYLAAVNADGTVTVWDMKQEPTAKQELRKRVGPKVR